MLASDTHLGRLRALCRELAPAADAGRGCSCSAPGPMSRRLWPQAGAILLDAPCTGLGTLSRRPDIKWKRQPSDVAALARTQAAMLTSAFAALAPGGQLHYLTCTLSSEENQRQTARFLESHPEARLAASWTTPPDVASGEFFYAASLQKIG